MYLQVYLGECTDAYIRSISINFTIVAISMGVLIVYWLGSFLHWHLIALYVIVLPVVSLLLLYILPESPAWLIRNQRINEAIKTMNWLRGDNDIARNEINEISTRIENENKIVSAEKLSFWTELKKYSAYQPFLIINLVIILINLSGSYLFVFYAVDIISGLGQSIDALSIAIYTACIRLIVNIIFCPLFYYVKRRPIFIISGLGSGISIISLALHLYWNEGKEKQSAGIYTDYVLLLIYIALSTAYMVAPSFLIGELLPSKVRARSAAYIYAAYSSSFFICAKFLLIVNIYLKVYGIFLIFGVAMLVTAFLIYLFVPETKGKTLNQIEDYYKRERWIYRGFKLENSQNIELSLISSNKR